MKHCALTGHPNMSAASRPHYKTGAESLRRARHAGTAARVSPFSALDGAAETVCDRFTRVEQCCGGKLALNITATPRKKDAGHIRVCSIIVTRIVAKALKLA